MSKGVPRSIRHCRLTHWGRVTHICVSKITIIGSDNGLSPDRRQSIIWTNAGLLSIGPLRTYFNENWIKIQKFSFKKMHMKMSSAKWRPSCLGLNVLTLTLRVLNCLKVVKDMLIFWILFWNRLHPSRLNWLWHNNTCCLSNTTNTMPADAVATLGARASAGTVFKLTKRTGIFRL